MKSFWRPDDVARMPWPQTVRVFFWKEIDESRISVMEGIRLLESRGK